MYFLFLTCESGETDHISAELWEAGTSGLQETTTSGDKILIGASFENEAHRLELLHRFRAYSPVWAKEPATDWEERTRLAWPGRAVGRRFFVAAPWLRDATPPGRLRLLQNPGLACGTGEHPCTQLALGALEDAVVPGVSRLADIGTGSGILAVAAWQLGAAYAIGVDPDEQALAVARTNFLLNNCPSDLIVGSADSLRAESFDIVVANISATVLLAIADDLVRIAALGASLILTGFPQSEASVIADLFPPHEWEELSGWSCIISKSL